MSNTARRMAMKQADYRLSELDRRVVRVAQEGLPLSPRPYHVLAELLGEPVGEVMASMRRMLDAGLIRRIGAVPNHYALGYSANGMSVWNVPDERIAEHGVLVGGLEFVSHCYQRPRHLPDWPYNLFVMVHGRDRNEALAKVNIIARLLGEDDRGHEILFSTRILKKTGLRIA